MLLLFLFVLLPAAEFTVLFLLGREIGVLNLIAAVALAAIIGGGIARTRGFQQWKQWQQSVSAGKMPDEGVMGGILILAACLFLILPGFVSDVIALALLIPPIRRLVAGVLRKRFATKLELRRIQVDGRGGVAGPGIGPFIPPGRGGGEKEVGGERLDRK